MITCAHRDRVCSVSTRSNECEECAQAGDRWVCLRTCLTCGHVGCCDSSRGRHANAHFEATGHPLMRSAEPGEAWAWCYVDRQAFETAEVSPPALRSHDVESVRPFIDALYRELLARGIEYFFPEARLEMLGPVEEDDSPRPDRRTRSGALDFAWLGLDHRRAGHRADGCGTGRHGRLSAAIHTDRVQSA
jgi:ubiquitin-hydrolase Zn-finger-containing protein